MLRQINRLFFIYLIFPSISCFGQPTEDFDSLNRYSYLLALCVPVGNSCNLSGMSTGFLLKDGKDVYLVSAYHVFTGINTTSNKSPSFVHKGMLVRIDRGISKNNFFINLETLKDWRKKISLYETPDIYFYKTKINPDSVNIYSIGNILKIDKDKKHTNMKIVSYGYLNHATDTTNIYSCSPLLYNGNIANTEDYSNYPYFKNLNPFYLVSHPKTFDGTSGSPVFFEYKKNRNSKKEWVEFGGMMVATDSINNCSVILKKEFVLSEFEKYKESLR